MKIILQTNSIAELREAAIQIIGAMGMDGPATAEVKTEQMDAPEPEQVKAEEAPAEATPAEEKKEETADEPPFETEDEVKVPDLSEVRQAVKNLQEAVGKERTKELLAKFGAKGASSVPEESRETFIKEAQEVING